MSSSLRIKENLFFVNLLTKEKSHNFSITSDYCKKNENIHREFN